MDTLEYREKYVGGNNSIYERVARNRGGVGTYSLDINILLVGDEFHRFELERRSYPAEKEGEFPSDEVTTLKIDIVWKGVDKQWRSVEPLVHEELRKNKYNDGTDSIRKDHLANKN